MLLIRLMAIVLLTALLGACGGGGSSGSLTTPPVTDSGASIYLEKTNLATGEEK